MGVPYLFKWISDAFPRAFVKRLPAVRAFYIDVNCVFHDCMNRMNEAGDGSRPRYFALVVETLQALVDAANPSELLYVAVDGVVPAAKMKQQRLRRYKADQEPDSGKPFRNIELSPQMPLMVELEAYIQAHLRSGAQLLFSSSAEPGEGEHKILAHLRASGLREGVCVYGTDGDWLLLTLPLDCRICLIKDHFEEQYLVDMDRLRDIFFERFGPATPSAAQPAEQPAEQPLDSPAAQPLDKYAVLQDVVFMSFLFGNDFVPRLYCLSLRFRKGGDHAFSVLREAYRALGERLVQDGAVRWEALFRLFFELQKRENDLVDAVVAMELQYVRRIFSQYRSRAPAEREAFRREFILPFQRTITDSALRQPHIYRQHYFQHHLKCRANLDWARWELARDYLQTLDWTLQYYLGNLRDWHHFYPHAVAPFLDDLHRLRRDWAPPAWPARNRISVDLQLLYIVPRRSLPPRLRPLADRPALRKHFPARLRTATMDRVRVWECEVDMLLPDVDDFAHDLARATAQK